jgi:flagellar FliJ protein
MAHFVFRFETLLEQRQRVEDDRQRDLARLLRQRMILESELTRMQQTITQSKHLLADSLVGKVNLDLVANFTRYSGQATQRARQIVVKLAAMQNQVQASRQRLLDATRARRALELLRDRHFQQWKRQEQRRETRRLDELTSQRYARDLMAEAGT